MYTDIYRFFDKTFHYVLLPDTVRRKRDSERSRGHLKEFTDGTTRTNKSSVRPVEVDNGSDGPVFFVYPKNVHDEIGLVTVHCGNEWV